MCLGVHEVPGCHRNQLQRNSVHVTVLTILPVSCTCTAPSGDAEFGFFAKAAPPSPDRYLLGLIGLVVGCK